MDSNKLYRIVGIIIFLIVLVIVGVSASKVDFSRNIKKVINSDPKKPEQNEVYNLFEGITTGSIYNSVYQNTVTAENLANIDVDSVDFENEDLNIMFFYIGQADSMFIKLKDKTMLIDAGNNLDGKNIVNFLKSKNISKIDYLVGTHADEDHIGGLDDIIREFEVARIFMPTVGSEQVNYIMAKRRADEKNISIENPKEGDTFEFNDATIKVISAMEGADIDNNESSLVIELDYKERKILFMADAGEIVENKHKWQDVDVLKVGHHGSSSSTTPEFLEQTKPEFAFVEVGKNNDYNLPNKKILERIVKAGAKLYRTDLEQSSFWVKVNESNIDVNEINLNLDGNT